MKKILLTVFITLSLVFGAATFGIFALTKSPLDDWKGFVELNVIKSDVFLKQGNSNYQMVNDKVVLLEGDTIRTDGQGEAEISFADGSIIRLSPKTEIQINQADLESLWKQSINVSVNEGKIWFRIIKIFDDGSSWEVETPTVVATVRGTAFGVELLDDENIGVLVAESEVFVKEKNKEGNAKEALAVAGQRMEISSDFTVKKEKLNLSEPEDQELRVWIDQNLEFDRIFQEELQMIMNEEILKNMEEEPGSFMYDLQIFAEDLRMGIAGEEELIRLEELQDDRRMAETLWLAEEGDYKELELFLDDFEYDDVESPFERFDRLPLLIDEAVPEMDFFFDMDILDENIYDWEALEKNVEILDLYSDDFDFYNDFDFDPDMEFIGPGDFYEFDEFMDWAYEYPEFDGNIDYWEDEFQLLPNNDMEALNDFFNDPVYLELLKEMEESEYIWSEEYLGEPIDFSEPIYFEDNFIEEPYYIDDSYYIEEPMYVEEPYYIDDPYYIEGPMYVEEPYYIDDPYYIEEPMYVEEPYYIDDPYYIEEPIYIEEPYYMNDPYYIEEPVYIELQ